MSHLNRFANFKCMRAESNFMFVRNLPRDLIAKQVLCKSNVYTCTVLNLCSVQACKIV